LKKKLGKSYIKNPCCCGFEEQLKSREMHVIIAKNVTMIWLERMFWAEYKHPRNQSKT